MSGAGEQARATSVGWLRIGTLALRGAGGEPIDFIRTLASHGVAELPPQVVDPAAGRLVTTLALGRATAATIRVRRHGGALLAVEMLDGGEMATGDRAQLLDRVRGMFGLDEDLSPFYALAASDPDLAWSTVGAGRMLRAPTVFEDVVKTICTTNCAWSGTVRMVTAIVKELGEPAPDGERAFPDAAGMASAGESFYRDVARAGYRGAYLVRLATEVAEGRLDLEELRDPEMSDGDAGRRLLALPGVGPYAAAHVMLVSLGRYRQLVLDSWTRPKYASLSGRAAVDHTIERRFRRFGDYAGLAFWLYVTRDWVED